MPACGCHCDGLSRRVDAGDLPFHASDADGDEHVIEGDPDRGQVRLVVAHTDVVEAVAVDQGHLHGIWATSEFVEFAGRANRAPEASKAASQHEDSLDAHEALSQEPNAKRSPRRIYAHAAMTVAFASSGDLLDFVLFMLFTLPQLCQNYMTLYVRIGKIDRLGAPLNA